MKIPITFLVVIFATLVLGSSSTKAQSSHVDSSHLAYENHNFIDPAPLVVSQIAGMVVDEEDVPIPGASIALFKEEDKKFVGQTESLDDGSFLFNSMSRGSYRLLVAISPFCTANIPLKTVRTTKGRKKIVVKMILAEIDTCSSAKVEAVK